MYILAKALLSLGNPSAGEWCNSFSWPGTIWGLQSKQRCLLWHLHGQGLWKKHSAREALWNPAQLQPCLLSWLHHDLAKNQRLSGRGYKVSLKHILCFQLVVIVFFYRLIHEMSGPTEPVHSVESSPLFTFPVSTGFVRGSQRKHWLLHLKRGAGKIFFNV